MYRNSSQQLEFENFILPFGGKLRSDNRWVKLSRLFPWEALDSVYRKNFSSSGMGAPAISSRVAIGSLIIKERLGTSDAETVEQIRENPYLQYFLGFEGFQENIPFDPSMFVHFRKRFPLSEIQRINEQVIQQGREETDDTEASDPPASDNMSDVPDNPDTSHKNVSNRGKLIVDATCAPADIAYPTDINLLNESREKAEEIIDTLHSPFIGIDRKPRTYRQVARKRYLNAAKSRSLSKRKLRKAIGSQLRFLRRDFQHIEHLSAQTSLSVLSRRQYRDLLVIQEVYRQQEILYRTRSKRIPERIVSISQPHVRPIVRGKAGKPTEFGAKISASLTSGYVSLDRLSWSPYNESGDLVLQVEAFKDRFGYYPASVHADKIYRNRGNRQYCQKRDIRLSGPPLGRPPKQSGDMAAQKKQHRQDELDRIAIEGKFGQGKRRFSLGRVMAKLASTSETAIAITFLVLNLEKILRDFLCSFLRRYTTKLNCMAYNQAA